MPVDEDTRALVGLLNTSVRAGNKQTEEELILSSVAAEVFFSDRMDAWRTLLSRSFSTQLGTAIATQRPAMQAAGLALKLHAGKVVNFYTSVSRKDSARYETYDGVELERLSQEAVEFGWDELCMAVDSEVEVEILAESESLSLPLPACFATCHYATALQRVNAMKGALAVAQSQESVTKCLRHLDDQVVNLIDETVRALESGLEAQFGGGEEIFGEVDDEGNVTGDDTFPAKVRDATHDALVSATCDCATAAVKKGLENLGKACTAFEAKGLTELVNKSTTFTPTVKSSIQALLKTKEAVSFQKAWRAIEPVRSLPQELAKRLLPESFDEHELAGIMTTDLVSKAAVLQGVSVISQAVFTPPKEGFTQASMIKVAEKALEIIGCDIPPKFKVLLQMPPPHEG